MKIFICITLICISSLAVAQNEKDERLVSIKLKSLIKRQNKLHVDTIITYQLTSIGYYPSLFIPENADKKTIDSLVCPYKTSTYVLCIKNGAINIDKLSPCLNFKPLKIFSPAITSILESGLENLALSKVKPFQYNEDGQTYGQAVSHSIYVLMTARFKGNRKEMSIDYYNLEQGKPESLNINYSANLNSLQYKLSEAIHAEIQKAKFQIAN